jgi:hypothetical protein
MLEILELFSHSTVQKRGQNCEKRSYFPLDLGPDLEDPLLRNLDFLIFIKSSSRAVPRNGDKLSLSHFPNTFQHDLYLVHRVCHSQCPHSQIILLPCN